MQDLVFKSFLQRQYDDGMAFASRCDLLQLIPWPGSPPDRYTAYFFCQGLIRKMDGDVVEHNQFEVDIWFPPDYLQSVRDYPHDLTFEILSWIGPRNVFHPNISDVAPFICVGHIDPGTSLVQLLEQCYAIITYNKVTMLETDALNHAACVWARNNQNRFPIDHRPITGRSLELQLESISEANS
jgi:hypothetical protein